jgi:predicted CopG family antitoxin
MRRREFLQSTAFMGTLFFLKKDPFFLNHWKHNKNSQMGQEKEAKTREIFLRVIQRALKEEWASLPIGECMGKIATLFIGTDYVGRTLEGKGPEICRVDLTGLDCVTFFENVLCLARVLKKEKTSFSDFIAELTFTRYRKGILTDYTSRLHYTSDWIQDNEEKRVVKNITEELGGEELPVRVSFMSENPGYYPALREFPEFIETITEIEKEINKRKHWYLPRKKIKSVRKRLQTGDIIAVTTSKEGLDYSHTGLVYRDEKNKIRFLHASSAKKKVLLDVQLHKHIKSVNTHTGITVARPLELIER